jgi:hypothetical protein
MADARAARAAIKTPAINTADSASLGLDVYHLGGQSASVGGSYAATLTNDNGWPMSWLKVGYSGNYLAPFSLTNSALNVPEKLYTDMSWMTWWYTPPGVDLGTRDQPFGFILETAATSVSGVAEDLWYTRVMNSAPTLGFFAATTPPGAGRSHMAYLQPVSSGILTQDAVHCTIHVRSSANSLWRAECWYDGAAVASGGTPDNTTGLTMTTRSSDGVIPKLFLGRGISRNFNGTVILGFAMWDRALTADEAARVSNNPLCIVRDSASIGSAQRKRLVWS